MFFLHIMVSTAFIGVIFLGARQFEKRFPLEIHQCTTEVVVDWKMAGLKWGGGQLLAPLANAYTIVLVNAAGGGWYQLRSDGWWFLLSLSLIILVIDFSGYVT